VKVLRPIAYALAATGLLLGAFGFGAAVEREQHLRPLAEVPLGADTHPEQRLGKAVGASDIGLGIPCAVYKNGPAGIVRKQTVVFWCAIP